MKKINKITSAFIIILFLASGINCQFPTLSFDLKRDVQNLDNFYPNKAVSPISNSAIQLYSIDEYLIEHPTADYQQVVSSNQFGGEDVTINLWLKLDDTSSISYKRIFDFAPSCDKINNSSVNRIRGYFYKSSSTTELRVYYRVYSTTQTKYIQNESRIKITQDLTLWNYISIAFKTDGSIGFLINNQAQTPSSTTINETIGIGSENYKCIQLGSFEAAYIDNLQVFKGTLTDTQQLCLKDNSDCISNCSAGQYEDSTGTCQQCPSNCATCRYGTHCESCKADTNANGADLNCSCKQDYTYNGSQCEEINTYPRLAFDLKKDISNLDIHYPNKTTSPASHSALDLYAFDEYHRPYSSIDSYNYHNNLSNVNFGGNDVTINFWVKIDNTNTHTNLIQFNNDPYCKSSSGTITDHIDIDIFKQSTYLVLDVDIERKRTVSPTTDDYTDHRFILTQNMTQWNYISVVAFRNGTVTAYVNNQELSLYQNNIKQNLGAGDVNFTCAIIGYKIDSYIDQLQIFDGALTSNQRNTLQTIPNTLNNCTGNTYEDRSGVCQTCPSNCASCLYGTHCETCISDPNMNGPDLNCQCKQDYTFNGTACEEITTLPRQAFALKKDIQNLDIHYPNKTTSPVSNTALSLEAYDEYHHAYDNYNYTHDLSNIQFGGEDVTVNFWLKMDSTSSYNLINFNNDPHCRSSSGTVTDSLDFDIFSHETDIVLDVDTKRYRTVTPSNKDNNEHLFILTQNLTQWNFFSVIFYSNGTITAFANDQQLTLKSTIINYKFGLRNINFNCALIGRSIGDYLDQIQVFDGAFTRKQVTSAYTHPNQFRTCTGNTYEDSTGVCQSCPSNCASCLYGTHCETCISDPNMNGPDLNCQCKQDYTFNGTACEEITTFPRQAFALKKDIQNLDIHYPNKTTSPVSNTALSLEAYDEYHHAYDNYNYTHDLSNIQFGGEDVTVNFWLKMESTSSYNLINFNNDPYCRSSSGTVTDSLDFDIFSHETDIVLDVDTKRYRTVTPSNKDNNEHLFILTQNLTQWNFFSVIFYSNGTITAFANDQQLTLKSTIINYKFGLRNINFNCALIGRSIGDYLDQIQVFDGAFTRKQVTSAYTHPNQFRTCTGNTYEDSTGVCQSCPSNCASCLYGTHCETCISDPNMNGPDLNCQCKQDYTFNGTTCEEITTFPRQAFALKKDIQNLDIHYPNKTTSPVSNTALSLEAYDEYHHAYDNYNYTHDLSNIQFGGEDVTVNFWLKMESTSSYNLINFNNDPYCRSSSGTVTDSLDFDIFSHETDIVLDVDTKRYRTVTPSNKDNNEHLFILTQNLTQWNFFSVIFYSNGTITAFANDQQLTLKSTIINYKFGLRNINFNCALIGRSIGDYLDQIQVFDGAFTRKQVTSAYTHPNQFRTCTGNTYEDSTGVCQSCPSNCASCLYGTHCETCISDPNMNGPDLNCQCKQDYTFNGTACVQISEFPRMAFDLKRDIQNIDSHYPNKESSPVSQSAIVLYTVDDYGNDYHQYNYTHDLTNIQFGGEDVTVNFWLKMDSNSSYNLINFNNDPNCRSSSGTVTDSLDFDIFSHETDIVLDVDTKRYRTVTPSNKDSNEHLFILTQNLTQWNFFSVTVYGNGTIQAYVNNQRLTLKQETINYKLGIRDINFNCATMGSSIGDSLDQVQVFDGAFTQNQRNALYNNPDLLRQCPADKYLDSQRVCQQCPSNCATCTYSQWCDSCNPDPNADASSATCACKEHYFFNGTMCEEITTYPGLVFDVKRDVSTLDEFYPTKAVSPVSSSAFLLSYETNDTYYYAQSINNINLGGGNVTFNFWMNIDNPNNHNHLLQLNNDPNCKSSSGTITDHIDIDVYKSGQDYIFDVDHERLRTVHPVAEDQNDYMWTVSQNATDLQKWNFVSFTIYSDGTASAQINGQDLIIHTQTIKHTKGVRNVNFTCALIGKAQGSYIDQFQVYNGVLTPRQQTCLQNNPNCPCVLGEYKDNTGNCHQCSPQCATCLNGNSCETCKEDPNAQGPEANCACKSGFEFNGSICVEIPCGTFEYRDSIDKTCKPCVSPCKTCQSASVCDSCVDTYFFDNTLSQCSPCSYPCANCSSSSTNCDSCVDNINRQGPLDGCACDPLYQDNGSNCELIPCGVHEYRHTDNTCKACQTPCKTCNSATVCESCVEQYYFVQSSNSCNACNYPCKNCSSATTCTSCATTANRKGPEFGCACETGYQDNGASCELIPCSEFEYRDISNICQPCQAPCKTCEDQNTCKSCVDEYYFDSFNSQCNLCVYPCKLCTSATQCSTCVNTENRVSPSTGDCDCISTYYDNGSICQKIPCHSDEILGVDGFCEKKRLDQEKFNLFIENEAQNKKFCISSNGFSTNEANVACKSLNYDSLSDVYSDQLCQSCDFNSLFYALTCNGTEKHWSDCQVTQINNQGSNECVAITCQRQ